MIPFDPCGMICDWGRHRYKTKCRFFRDDDVQHEIEWYPAPPGAKCLPFPSAFNQSIWRREPNNIDPYTDGVGEVWDAKHETTHSKPVPLTGTGRFCGTASMFLLGATYDPLFKLLRRPDGLPVCCPGGIGGILWGGRGSIALPGRGGMLWRGRAKERWPPTIFATDGTHSIMMFRNLTDPDIYTAFLANRQIWTPERTGVAERWWFVDDVFDPIFGQATWGVDGWNGWGTTTMTLISGEGPPTITVTGN